MDLISFSNEKGPAEASPPIPSLSYTLKQPQNQFIVRNKLGLLRNPMTPINRKKPQDPIIYLVAGRANHFTPVWIAPIAWLSFLNESFRDRCALP